MVELKKKVIHSNTYDIDIRQYLTYAQIQQIVNAIEATGESDDSWSTRQTNIDMLVLFHATDIEKEKLEEIGHEALLTCGLIDEVNNTIVNLRQIYEAIGFTESMTRVGFKFISQLPKLLDNEMFNAVLNKYGKTSQK